MTAWVNELTAVVRFLDEPNEDFPAEAWILTVGGGELDEPLGPEKEVVERLAELDTERPPYVLETRLRRFSWGASGESEDLWLDVGKTLITDVVKAALRDALKRIVGRVRQDPPAFEGVPWTREGLEHVARWTLVQDYRLGGEPEDLELVEDAHDFDASAWRFCFRRDDWFYAVELMEQEPTHRLVKVERWRES